MGETIKQVSRLTREKTEPNHWMSKATLARLNKELFLLLIAIEVEGIIMIARIRMLLGDTGVDAHGTAVKVVQGQHEARALQR